MALSDEEWIAAFLAGDQQAFLELVDRYERPLLALLQRMTKDRQAAEDLFQEVLLKVYRTIAQLRDRTRFRVWMFRIAVHHVRRFLGRRKPMMPLAAEHDKASMHADPVDDLELRAALRTAVEELPERQREVVLLRTYQGMSYQEIAHCLAVSEENARANYYQALKKLKASFGKGAP